jgi:hypothetical protein
LKLIAVAASQRDYASEGPLGPKSDYMRNAVIPNLHLQLHYSFGEHFVGVGGDYKVLKPRLISDSLYKTDARVVSMAVIGFARLNFKKADIKLQGSWGENLTEHTMLGGYFEKEIDPLTGEVKYGNMSSLNAWIDVSSKGAKWKFGMFAGYTKNLGYSNDIAAKGKFYGRGNTIDLVYRVAPRITYTAGQLVVGSEFEYTAITYGTPDKKGKVNNTSSYDNFRVLLSASYNF